MLRKVTAEDAPSICNIYNHYVHNTPITFEEFSVSVIEMQSRIVSVTRDFPWIVCVDGDEVVGYAYAANWKERSAYRHSVEATIYLHPSSVGKGKGSELMAAVITELRAREVHCVIGGVALPNLASVALLEKFGLRQVAHFREVGYKFGQWIDVGYWQLVL